MMTLAKIGKVRFVTEAELSDYLKGRLNATYEPYLEEQLSWAIEHHEREILFAGFIVYGKKRTIKPGFVECDLEYDSISPRPDCNTRTRNA